MLFFFSSIAPFPEKKTGVTKFLSKTSLYRLWDWFDDQTWYPLGRVVGGTVYPVRKRGGGGELREREIEREEGEKQRKMMVDESLSSRSPLSPSSHKQKNSKKLPGPDLDRRHDVPPPPLPQPPRRRPGGLRLHRAALLGPHGAQRVRAGQRGPRPRPGARRGELGRGRAVVRVTLRRGEL